MDQGICFSTPGIGIITLLLGAMAGVVRILYLQAIESQKEINRILAERIKEQSETIDDQRLKMDRMLTVGEATTQVTGALVETTRHVLQ